MATGTPPAVTGNWQVTKQVQSTGPDGTGRIVPGMTVHFTTRTGTAAKVFVTEAAYRTVTKVKKAVHTKAAAIIQAGKLTG